MRQALFLEALRVTLSGLGAGGKSANVQVDRLMEMRKPIPRRAALTGEVLVSWIAFIRNYGKEKGKRL